MQFYRIKGEGGSGRPPPIILEPQILPQETIYRWKGNLTDFMNTLRNFSKSVFTHIFATFEYFEKVIIYSKSPDHVSKTIYNMFIF